MTGADIFREMVDFIGQYPQVFPISRSESWTPAITAFIYKLGTSEGYEVRCGDYSPYLAKVRTARRLTSLPGGYDRLCQPWETNGVHAHGVLAIDACWVPPGFSIPRRFTSVPTPVEARIFMAYEHEDEGTLYTDLRGTNLNVVLDEVRKIGNVRSDRKVISYITSRSEILGGNHIETISREIKLVPQPEALTGEWFIIQIGKYASPNSRKANILTDGQRFLCLRGTALNGAGDPVGQAIDADVAFPA